MRLRSARVACGLARTSSRLASAVVQLALHLSRSPGKTPCSRHQALLLASFTVVVKPVVAWNEVKQSDDEGFSEVLIFPD